MDESEHAMILSSRIRGCLPTAILALALVLALMTLMAGYIGIWSVQAAPPVASEPEIPDCEPFGKIGNEVLYFCESDFGPDCVWDPSPALGAGVMDCD